MNPEADSRCYMTGSKSKCEDCIMNARGGGDGQCFSCYAKVRIVQLERDLDASRCRYEELEGEFVSKREKEYAERVHHLCMALDGIAYPPEDCQNILWMRNKAIEALKEARQGVTDKQQPDAVTETQHTSSAGYVYCSNCMGVKNQQRCTCEPTQHVGNMGEQSDDMHAAIRYVEERDFISNDSRSIAGEAFVAGRRSFRTQQVEKEK